MPRTHSNSTSSISIVGSSRNRNVDVNTDTKGGIISHTVSFHNFKSQNFKLSVSNPKSRYVAYVSVLSRISNCQGLGRKKIFEILKTEHNHDDNDNDDDDDKRKQH